MYQTAKKGHTSHIKIRNTANHLQLQCALMHSYRDLAPLQRTRFFSVYHPDYLHHILIANEANYDKQDFTYKMVMQAIGSNLLTDSDYETWHQKRRALQPTFKPVPCNQLQALIVKNALPMLNGWDKIAKDQSTFDFARALRQMVIHSSQQILLGEQFNEIKLLDNFSTVLNRYVHRSYGLVPYLPFPTAIRFKRLKKHLHLALDKVMETTPHSNILNILQSIPQCSREQIRAELVMLLITGFESTSNSLYWVFERLWRNPAIQEALQAELSQFDSVEELSHFPIAKLDLCRRIFKEIIRLYPPVWIFGRRARASDMLGPHEIKAGDELLICPYAIHRHPDYWHRAEAFDPDRFLPNPSHPFPEQCYLPFGMGPRICLGMNLALVQGTLLTAMIAKKFKINFVNAQFASPDPLLFLRIKEAGYARLVN